MQICHNYRHQSLIHPITNHSGNNKPLDEENATRYDDSVDDTRMAFAPTPAVSTSLLTGSCSSSCDPTIYQINKLS